MVSSDTILVMKTMAADPKKRCILMKDTTCIGGLVLVLSNPDLEVVRLALETICLLAESPGNRPLLRDFIGMMDQIQELRQRMDCQTAIGPLVEKTYHLLCSADFTPLKDSVNTTKYPRKASSCSGVGPGEPSCKAKTLILQLRGVVNRCDRDVCMRLLLQVKGVISITFDLGKKRCILRTKPDVRAESLVHAVAKTQSICAQQVVKNEAGEELLLSFGSSHKSLDKENGPDLPDYLPDDGDSPVIDDKAIARNKSDTSKSGGWLSSAASFLTSSFYW